MTRSSTDPLYNLDPKLELTLRRLRKARKIVVNNSSSSNSIINSNQVGTDGEQRQNPEGVSYTRCGVSTLVHPISTAGANLNIQIKIWSYSFAAKISWSCRRRSQQALERIPHGLFHNETIGDPGRLYQDEGIPILT
ncbi:hypothetical protein CR513_06153, partial [Mucuna pruriens]